MTETPEQIAARYGAVCRPGLRVTVCPAYATTDDAWQPVEPKLAMRREMRKRALGARLRAADRGEAKPIEQLVMVSGPVRQPRAKPGPKPKPKVAKPTPRPRESVRDRYEAQVRAMHADGRNDGEISAALGFNRKTICAWRQAWGLAANDDGGGAKTAEFNRLMEAHGETVKAMHAAGEFDTAIADSLGVTNNQIGRMRRVLGLPTQGGRRGGRKKNVFCDNDFRAKKERAENARQRGPGPDRNASL